jgi:hypothetical protein
MEVAMSDIGTKRWENIAGREIPAIQISEARRVQVTPAGRVKPIPVMEADLLSLRTTNPLNPDGSAKKPEEIETYLTVTTENLRFAPLRFTLVDGLDYDAATGAYLSIEELEQRRGENIRARQAQRLATLTPQVVELD